MFVRTMCSVIHINIFTIYLLCVPLHVLNRYYEFVRELIRRIFMWKYVLCYVLYEILGMNSFLTTPKILIIALDAVQMSEGL